MKVLWVHNFPISKGRGGFFVQASVDALIAAGVEVECVELSRLNRPWWFLRQLRNCARRVRSADYDMVHAQFGSACGALVALMPGKKLLYLRGSDWYRLPLSSGISLSTFVHSLLQSALTRLSISRFDAVVCVSERMASEVRKLSRAPTTYVVPSPIDLARFVPLDRNVARRELGWDVSGKYVLFSSLNKGNAIKRPELAREAVELAARAMPGISIKTISGLTHAQMPLVFAAANVTLMTSQYEGWPNSIKESLACGTPVVSTDISDVRRTIEYLPCCQIVSEKPEDIASALLNALMNDMTLEDRGALSLAALQFGYEKFSTDIQRVYASYLGSRTSHEIAENI